MTRALTLLISAMISVESGGNPTAVGKNGEAGCLQIRYAVLRDVNGFQDTIYFTGEDRFDRQRSIAICQLYLSHYATRERLGHEPTDQDRARIWNGGPNGWDERATLPYWNKVKRELGQ